MRRPMTALLAMGSVGVGVTLASLRKPPSLPSPLEGEEHTYRWRGMDITYTTAGNPSDPDVVCFHGIHAAATSNEFDGIWRELAEQYHVVAPDLPGFGRSDRPDITYSSDVYESFIADFTDDVLTDPICLATSVTGAFALKVADSRFQELVLVCPTTQANGTPWLQPVLRSPVIGELLFAGLTVPWSLRRWNRREGYGTPTNPSAATIEYQHRSVRQPGARFAPAAFIGGALTPSWSLKEPIREATVPVTLLWGRDATRPPVEIGRELATIGDMDLLVVDHARLLPHAEYPDVVLRGLRKRGVLSTGKRTS